MSRTRLRRVGGAARLTTYASRARCLGERGFDAHRGNGLGPGRLRTGAAQLAGDAPQFTRSRRDDLRLQLERHQTGRFEAIGVPSMIEEGVLTVFEPVHGLLDHGTGRAGNDIRKQSNLRCDPSSECSS